MTITSRPYKNAEDLPRMQALTQQLNGLNDGVGLLHVGDIPHRIFNAGRWYQPQEIVYLWEENDQLVAWIIIFPRTGGFDVAIHPDYWERLQGGFLAQSEQYQRQLEQKLSLEARSFGTDVLEMDVARIAWLEGCGYVRAAHVYTLNTRSLSGSMMMPELPEGYAIRCVTGDHEAGKLVEVHSGAFGSEWTEDLYRQVMHSPGYDMEWELVVVAPDGRWAAFCIIWLDLVNKTGLFEPVGAHGDFRRLGLTRALMTEGMRRMQTVGVETAIVLNAVNNPAAKGLYAAVGFKPKNAILSYHKPVIYS